MRPWIPDWPLAGAPPLASAGGARGDGPVLVAVVEEPLFWTTLALAVACAVMVIAWVYSHRRHVREFATRLQTHDALRAERDRANWFLDMAGAILIAIDPEGIIALLNRRGHEILGYRNGELLGRNWFDTCLPEDERESVRAVHKQVIAGRIEAVEYHENAVLTKSGERRQIAWYNALLRDEHGAPVWSLSAGEDITQRQRHERERERMIKELESQNAELERFTYMVSHDLKSPLITVKGYMGLLRQDLARGDLEAVEDDLARMSNAADRMEALLGELLELSRIGRLVNPHEDVSLGELAREAVELVAGQIADQGVEVIIGDDLPIVHGDRTRLLEVVQNLVDNAVKYMGTQPHPRVEIGVRRDGNVPVCFVRDNGIGIERRYHEQIFGLFNKLDARSEGTGVGLAMVKRIVEVHGGRVWVESEGRGHGCTFCFHIPQRAPAPCHEETVS